MFKFLFVLFCVFCVGFCFHYSDYPFEVEWTITGGIITFTASCTNSSGYVAYGICPPGNNGMNGSDIGMGGVKPNGERYFADYHGRINDDQHLRPLKDKIQDWILLDAKEESMKTTIVFSRPLNTGDPDDVTIVAQPMTAIWACSINDNLSYHGRDRRGGHYVSFLSGTPPVITSTTTTTRATTTTTIRPSRPTSPPRESNSNILKPFAYLLSITLIILSISLYNFY